LTIEILLAIFNHMVKYVDAELDAVFHALADSTRRNMLHHMSKGGSTVTELAKPFDMSLAAISKHLKVLERANLISRKKEGRIHHCYLNAEAMLSANEWLAHYDKFWNNKLDALESFLDQQAFKTKDEKSNDRNK